MQSALRNERLENTFEKMERGVHGLAVRLEHSGGGRGGEGEGQRGKEGEEIEEGVQISTGGGSWREEGAETGDAGEGRVGRGGGRWRLPGRSSLRETHCATEERI